MAASPLPFPLVVPAPVGAVLARLPAYPGSQLLVTALNLALARHLPADVGQVLLHKKMRVQVRDARVAFDFAWTGQRFAPHAPLYHSAEKLEWSQAVIAADGLRMPEPSFYGEFFVKKGELSRKLTIKGVLLTAGAKAAVEAAGGSVEE